MALTYDYIKSLTEKREGVDVEFKESTGQLDRGMESLCGMMNGCGGIVVFGIKNNGKIIGQEVADKTTRMIGEALNRFDPAVDLQPTYIPIPDSDRQIIAFQTSEYNDNKPYTYDGRPYQRHDSVTTRMPRDKYMKIAEEARGFKYKWEEMTNPNLTIADLDTELIKWVMERGLKNGRLSARAESDAPETILTRMKVLDSGKITNGAAVLFGKNLLGYPQMMVRMARFKGNDKRIFIDNRRMEGNIFEIYDAANDFFFKHLNLTSRMAGWERIDELEIPIDALRECILNACAHRDWRRESSSIGIAIFDDRIEVENAGRFPQKLSPNKIIKDETLQERPTSEPPNPVIANVLYYSGLIEQWGRGIALMFDECKRVHAPAPQIIDDGFVVRVTFPRPNFINEIHDETGQHCSTDRTVAMKDTTANGPYTPGGSVENEMSQKGKALNDCAYTGDKQKNYPNNPKNRTAEKSRTVDIPKNRTVIITSEPSNKSVQRLIMILGDATMSAAELRISMALKSKGSFYITYLKPAIDEGFVKAQNENSLSAPNQRYRLTDKGLAYYYKHRV